MGAFKCSDYISKRGERVMSLLLSETAQHNGWRTNERIGIKGTTITGSLSARLLEAIICEIFGLRNFEKLLGRTTVWIWSNVSIIYIHCHLQANLKDLIIKDSILIFCVASLCIT